MDIQQNNVAVLHFNLVNQDGSTIFIRKTKLATFNLINPSAVSVPITDIGFDATLNQCWIRVPKASNATTGQYYGVLNIVDDDWGTYTTSKIKVYSVVSDADEDTKSVIFTATCLATQVTNPSGGNSPYYNTTTSTWWQYSDTLKAFEDTGVGNLIQYITKNVQHLKDGTGNGSIVTCLDDEISANNTATGLCSTDLGKNNDNRGESCVALGENNYIAEGVSNAIAIAGAQPSALDVFAVGDKTAGHTNVFEINKFGDIYFRPDSSRERTTILQDILDSVIKNVVYDSSKCSLTVTFYSAADNANKIKTYDLSGLNTALKTELDQLAGEVLGRYSAISPTVTLNKMYVNADLIITDLSSVAGTWDMGLYCYEVTKGQIIRINIPKTNGYGNVLSFFYNLPAATVIGGSFVDGITNSQPLVDYLYTSPDDGYLCVGYNTTENPPTAEVYIQGLENLEGRVSGIEEELASEIKIDSDASAYAYVSTAQQAYIVLSSTDGFKSKIYRVIKDETYRYYIADTKSEINIPVSFFEEIPSNGGAIYSALDVQGGSGIAAEGTFIAPINGYVCLCGDMYKGIGPLVQVKGTIYNRISTIKAEVDGVKESSVSRKELYSEEETVYELPDELIGTFPYNGQTGCGIVHKAAEREVFNRIACCVCRPQTANTGTFAIYKSSSTPDKKKAESILSINNFSSDNFAAAGELFTIDFDNDVVLEKDEYLFTYFSGICSLCLYATATRMDESKREGFVFQGSYNTYYYSSSMTLSIRSGDIVALRKAIGESSTEDVKITIPDDLYCVKGKPQWFYYNTFIFGKESVYGNSIDNYHIETTASTQSIGTEKEDGFCIEADTAGNYSIEIRIYDQEMNFIVSKIVTVHVAEYDNAINGSNILMLGDSWTDPSIPISSQFPAKGYTAETDAALKELGITLNFVGSIDCGVNGLKNEGRGGYAWDTYSKAPTQVQFKFFMETMPNASIGDVYTNNGSGYTVFEKGDRYITMTRTSGTSIPSGNTLTKSSGSGDATITFTSYSQTAGNPFWNPTSEKVDFTYWRNLICLSDTLDIVTIQLGVNDCLGTLKTTKSQWRENIDGAKTIIDAILDDSPSCKIIVNLVGLDAPSNTAWSSLNGLSSGKATYQKNVYYLRKYINEMLLERGDFGTSVFIGQSVLGMNRWSGYEYLDKRDVYFQINIQTLDLTILNNLRNKTYTFFMAGNVYLRLYGYDERGYAILRPFLGPSWEGRDQEFTGSKSDFDFSTIPPSGNLVLSADSSIVIPYTTFKIENDNLKTHYFTNATHPHARGYREMARTLVAQIISI